MTELCCVYLSALYIWECLFLFSLTTFIVNPHSIVDLISRNYLLKEDVKSKLQVTVTGRKPTTT